MKLRSVVAVVVGGLVWAAVSALLLYLEARAWPAMAEGARAYAETGSYAGFDTPMLVSFQVMWLITNAFSGFITGLIARRGAEVAVLAIVLVAYFAYNHLWALWDDLPVWYNVVVVLLVVPLVLVGGRLARLVRARRIATGAAAAG
jgi:hypothetical protein